MSGGEPGYGEVRGGEQQAEIAEADAFEGRVGGAAGAGGDEGASPPGFEHRICAEAGVSGAGGEGAKEIGERAADKEEDGDPERDQSADGEEGEEEIFDDAVAEDIELGAERSREVAGASEVAVEAIEGDGGDGEDDGGEVGGERVAEEGEESDGGEGGGDSREGDLVGRHGAPSVVNALLRNFWARHRSGDFGGRFRLQLASPCGGDSISCARSVARVGACFQEGWAK